MSEACFGQNSTEIQYHSSFIIQEFTIAASLPGVPLLTAVIQLCSLMQM